MTDFLIRYIDPHVLEQLIVGSVAEVQRRFPASGDG